MVRRKAALNAGDPFAQVRQITTNAVESGVHFGKTRVHLRETLIHLGKAVIDLSKAEVHRTETTAKFGAHIGHVASLLGLTLKKHAEQ